MNFTRDDFLQSIKQTYDECYATAEKKNHDYATHDQPFMGIESVRGFGIDPQAALLVRMCDKFVRMTNLIHTNPQDIHNEPIVDTITDLINYLAILKAYQEYIQCNKTKKSS